MKIFLLADGSSAHTEKWVKSLLANNIKVFLFSLRLISKELESMVSDQLEVYSCEKNVRSNASAFSKSTYLTVIPEAKKQINYFKPDIVHAHYISSYGLLAFLSGFRPYVLSVWGSDIMVFPKRSLLHKFIIKLILKNARQVFATSKLMLEIVQKEFNKYESVRLPFGIDTKLFQPSKNSIKEEKFTFIILKSHAFTYGIDIAIEAFTALKEKYPKRAMQFYIYGDGAKTEEYKALAGNLLNRSIYFKGRIPSSQAPKALQQADVMINISRSESFGVSVLEASACGLAVIVSNRGGLPETVIPNETALMLNELNVNECAEAMETYLNNPELVSLHGKNGRAFVLENYRQEKLAEIQVEAYRKMIQKNIN